MLKFTRSASAHQISIQLCQALRLFFFLHYSLEVEIPTVTTTASVVIVYFILFYVPRCLCLQTLASPEHLLETLQIRQPPSIRQMPLRP